MATDETISRAGRSQSSWEIQTEIEALFGEWHRSAEIAPNASIDSIGSSISSSPVKLYSLIERAYKHMLDSESEQRDLKSLFNQMGADKQDVFRSGYEDFYKLHLTASYR